MPGVEWRNDHTANSSATEWSLDNVVIPQVKKVNSAWSDAAVREEGVRIWKTRLAQDKKFSDDEVAHHDGSVQWEIAEIDGRQQLVTRYGDTFTTLEQLWENTEKFAASQNKSHLVNQEEKAAQLEMQRKFITGEAVGFASALSHPDSVEFVQTWEKTGEKKFVSKQIDLVAEIGRTLSHSEGAKLIQRIVDSIQHTGKVVVGKAKSVYPHFMIEIGKFKSDVIRAIVRTMDIAKQEVIKMPQKAYTFAERTFLKVQAGFGQVIRYVREKIDTSVHSIKHLIEVSLPETKKQKEMSHVITRKPKESVVTRTVKRFKETVRQNKVLKKEKKTAEKSTIIGTFRVPVHIRYEILEQRIRQKARGLTKRIAETYMIVTKKITKRIEINKNVNFFKNILKHFSLEKKKNINGREQKSIREKKSKLLLKKRSKMETRIFFDKNVILKKLTGIKERIRIKIDKKLERPRVEKKRLLREQIVNFSIAVVLWLLMRLPEKRRDVKVTTHEKLAKLVPQEPTQWLLLAIIWHLAMIREGGNRTVYKQKKAKKQARHYYSAFIPPQGVIFTFAS